ncbi:hypothetical protein [Pseudomonas sp. NPDC099000]|uniref:hypothetical protein n=1 Tax=Pseudomonas sp. NPDC099000 TaxID=3364488 RepID=UPI00383BF540
MAKMGYHFWRKWFYALTDPHSKGVLPMPSPLDPLLQSLQSIAARDSHTLSAFRVGELDIYAATSAEQALALAARRDGENRHTAGDVRPVSAELLDRPMVVDGREETLRGWLRVTAVPGWLARGVWVEVDLVGGGQ